MWNWGGGHWIVGPCLGFLREEAGLLKRRASLPFPPCSGDFSKGLLLVDLCVAVCSELKDAPVASGGQNPWQWPRVTNEGPPLPSPSALPPLHTSS